MKAFIRSWTHGADWKTWVAHSVIALIIFTPAALVFGADVGTAAAIGYYLIRELEQLLYGWVDHDVDRDWLDHFMDVACPAAVVLSVTAVTIWL